MHHLPNFFGTIVNPNIPHFSTLFYVPYNYLTVIPTTNIFYTDLTFHRINNRNSSSYNNKHTKSPNLRILDFIIGANRLFPTQNFTETPWLHDTFAKITGYTIGFPSTITRPMSIWCDNISMDIRQCYRTWRLRWNFVNGVQFI